MPDLARPCALEHFDAIVQRLAARPPAVFLDYDGTLVPIAPRPDQARLPETRRAMLERLASACPVAIVTGRALDDIERLVDSTRLYYAASHGYDISGPAGVRHQPAPSLSRDIDVVASRLSPHVERVPGAVMESKVFSIAVHFRLVSPGAEQVLEQAIDEALADRPALTKASGKMLFEIRPSMDWHKGAALSWLLDHFAARGPMRVPLFIGDDTTDEDALRAVAPIGVGVFVGPPPPWNTAAHYGLADARAVETFVRRLVERWDRQ
jgi:trehalose 6-phosphate phosphatase